MDKGFDAAWFKKRYLFCVAEVGIGFVFDDGRFAVYLRFKSVPTAAP